MNNKKILHMKGFVKFLQIRRRELIPGYLEGITGEYETPAGYFVDEAGVEELDKSFTYKEKLKLPG